LQLQSVLTTCSAYRLPCSHRGTIERWKKENDHIRTEISAIEARQAASESDAQLTSKLQTMHTTEDKYRTKLEEQQQRVYRLSNEVKVHGNVLFLLLDALYSMIFLEGGRYCFFSEMVSFALDANRVCASGDGA